MTIYNLNVKFTDISHKIFITDLINVIWILGILIVVFVNKNVRNVSKPLITYSNVVR